MASEVDKIFETNLKEKPDNNPIALMSVKNLKEMRGLVLAALGVNVEAALVLQHSGEKRGEAM